MIINSIEDFAEYHGTKVEHLKKDLYKYTECGAWIEWDAQGITIGSIVEGSDTEFAKELKFPFDSDAYEAWMKELEALVDEAWHEANDCNEDDDTVI